MTAKHQLKLMAITDSVKLQADIDSYFKSCEANAKTKTEAKTPLYRELCKELGATNETIKKYLDGEHSEKLLIKDESGKVMECKDRSLKTEENLVFDGIVISRILKKSLAKCEVLLSRDLLRGKGNTAVGIFILKNVHGWKDRNEQDIKVNDGKPLKVSLI